MKPLEFQAGVWNDLLTDLRKRGKGRRESGAFLLGCETESVKSVTRWVSYEDLDPKSKRHAIIKLDTSAFPKLWEVCAAFGLQVMADVHTHPGRPIRSLSDRAYPMLSIAGHVALIVPRFAAIAVTPTDVSFNIYLGSGSWRSLYGSEAGDLIRFK
jgi:proteasome lid subunit RPN8/RPN11